MGTEKKYRVTVTGNLVGAIGDKEVSECASTVSHLSTSKRNGF